MCRDPEIISDRGVGETVKERERVRENTNASKASFSEFGVVPLTHIVQCQHYGESIRVMIMSQGPSSRSPHRESTTSTGVYRRLSTAESGVRGNKAVNDCSL